MEPTQFAWLVLVVALVVVGFWVGRSLFPKYRSHLSLRNWIKELIQPPPIVEVGGSQDVPAKGGGTCHFVDDARKVDVLIMVPEQKQPVALTFQSTLPQKEHSNPTRETIYRVLMGVNVHVTGDQEKRVHHFDPAIMTVARYYDIDLQSVRADSRYKDDPEINNNEYAALFLIRLLHDGVAWRRLPMPIGARDTKKMTLTALTESFSDCGHGGG